ncbi:MAG: hypothetical protein C4550_01635 [Nitrospiraceae bacterium]|nr:MAG: hypothetical protein C4550_01635 [Nitrospiraceae bacterium]
MKQCLYLIAAIVLLVGLGSAVLIYLTSESDSSSSLISEFEGSKRFKHDLELYGGKWNVVANELINWFAGLWQGKTLAFTTACITIVISFGFFLAARHLPPNLKSGEQDERNQKADFIL